MPIINKNRIENRMSIASRAANSTTRVDQQALEHGDVHPRYPPHPQDFSQLQLSIRFPVTASFPAAADNDEDQQEQEEEEEEEAEPSTLQHVQLCFHAGFLPSRSCPVSLHIKSSGDIVAWHQVRQ